MMINDDCGDVKLNVEEGGVPAAVDCLGMRGSALLSQLPGQGIRYHHCVQMCVPHLVHGRCTL